jgi:hypothetical protein
MAPTCSEKAAARQDLITFVSEIPADIDADLEMKPLFEMLEKESPENLLLVGQLFVELKLRLQKLRVDEARERRVIADYQQNQARILKDLAMARSMVKSTGGVPCPTSVRYKWELLRMKLSPEYRRIDKVVARRERSLKVWAVKTKKDILDDFLKKRKKIVERRER